MYPICTKEDRVWLQTGDNPYIFFCEGDGEFKRGWYFWDIHKISYRAEPLPTLESIIIAHNIYCLGYDSYMIANAKERIKAEWKKLNVLLAQYEEEENNKMRSHLCRGYHE